MGPTPPEKKTSRLVLIGTATYRAEAYPDLPNIKQNVQRLWELLAGGEDSVFDPASTRRITDPESPSAIGGAIMGAVTEAEDVLFIYYAGHAYLGDGKLSLLPTGATGAQASVAAWDGFSIDLISGALRNARAKRIVLVLDTCFSGAAASGGVPTSFAEQAEDAGWVFIMSSSPYQPSSSSDGKGHTAFTGKLIQGLAEGIDSADGGLAAEHVQLRKLFEYATNPDGGDQNPQWVGSVKLDVALGRNPMRPHELYLTWTASARDIFRAANLPDVPGREQAGEVVMDLVGRMAQQSHHARRRIAGDPWHSPEFADRMSRALADLLSGPAKLELDLGKAVVLALMPFVYATWWERGLADALGVGGPEEAGTAIPGYREYLDRHPAQLARATSARQRGKEASAQAIHWWLFRQWLVQESLTDLSSGVLGGIADDLGAAVAAHDSFALQSDILPITSDHFLVAWLKALLVDPDPRETEPLVKILAIAQQMAMDPIRLPTAIDHISASSDFDPQHIARNPGSWRTLKKRDDTGTVDIYDLNAVCDSPEVASVLRAHCAALDHYVLHATAVADPSSAFRKIIPSRYASLGVVPASTPHGGLKFSPSEMRFTLDYERIRELLMGTQIYEHPGLAFRELFQNALDACRYRKNRIDLLARASGATSRGNWVGKITFSCGEEDGRHYIECEDNGVGMGAKELEELFARGGTRFAMSREYLEEQADWRHYGISMNPNSAFGIGVFSYFMLAEEIRVTTSRYSRQGAVGRALRVDIAGPGALFHITDATRSGAGTTVRLYLKAGVEATPFTEVLRRWVWTSDCVLEATLGEGKDTLRLAARTLSDEAPIGSSSEEEDHGPEGAWSPPKRAEDLRVTPAGDPPDVWWCSGPGGVLRDGIWFDYPLFGAVVNLVGAEAPALTVDRARPKDPDAVGRSIDRRLRERVNGLTANDDSVLSPYWLSQLARHRLELADEIFRAAIEGNFASWVLNGRKVDIGIVGCFTPEVASPVSQKSSWLDSDSKTSAAWINSALELIRPFSPIVQEWRIRAWVKAGLIPELHIMGTEGIPTAVPSDSRIMPLDGSVERSSGAAAPDFGADFRRVSYQLSLKRLTAVDVIRSALRSHLGYDQTRARLRELGWDVSATPAGLEPVHDDLVLLSQDRDGDSPWLDAARAVPLAHLLAVAARTGTTAEQVRERLDTLGFHQLPEVIPDLHKDDPVLLSRELRGERPWLDEAEEVPLAHVLAAAARTGTPAEQVRQRLLALGFGRVPGALPDGLPSPHQDDAVLLSSRLQGEFPWLDEAEEVPLAHVLAAAARTGTPAEQVRQRLLALGFGGVPGPLSAATPFPHKDDPVLLSHGLDEGPPWLDATQDVPLAHILVAAARSDASAEQVRARLLALGFGCLPEAIPLPQEDDLVLISCDLDGSYPWLDPGEEVPLAHILAAAAETRAPAEQVRARFQALGFQHLPEAVPLPHRDDRILLSTGLHGEPPWLEVAEDVPLAHIMLAAAETGTPAEQVRVRFQALGFQQLPEGVPLPHQDDRILLSRGLDGESPWLEPGQRVPLAHVLAAAAMTGTPAAQIRDRLGALGFPWLTDAVPDPLPHPRKADLVLLSRDLHGEYPWLDPGEEVPLAHVLAAAARTDTPAAQVLERLVDLGFQDLPESVPDSLPHPHRDDPLLLSRDLDGVFPWLDPDQTVPLVHILRAMKMRGGSKARQVAARLESLGYRLPEGIEFV